MNRLNFLSLAMAVFLGTAFVHCAQAQGGPDGCDSKTIESFDVNGDGLSYVRFTDGSGTYSYDGEHWYNRDQETGEEWLSNLPWGPETGDPEPDPEPDPDPDPEPDPGPEVEGIEPAEYSEAEWAYLMLLELAFEQSDCQGIGKNLASPVQKKHSLRDREAKPTKIDRPVFGPHIVTF